MEKVKAVKPELEFTDYSNFEAEVIPQVKGLSQRIIAQIPGSIVATRILQFEPGTNTSPMGVQLHDFWEELYIIEGSIIDLELNEEFKAGAVACRPPGMKHGPWKTSEGCKIFEVRYYTKGQ
ncbi:cupin domain-containing protein [Neobacillus sp. SuZ13]|uniref:cupin domain-containing protein n=1 Tax=Neobacillus sp. SuZ13 TaxID=3047875 RepID=UPI0024C03527|nr:cupin domain-containing protein [Neobacillus sp. SuZ13]WHY67705.1 cupin domain-containing protein [Neobacillus sp. SuZ13]